jgi:hypothetical protein
MYDVKQLIAAVRARNGIRVEPDDPVFALVTLNELVLEQVARRVSDEITTRLVAFNAGMDKTERRAGSLLAQDVKEAGAQIRAELQKDIDAAGMKAAYLVYKVDQAHKRPTMIRWITVGLSLSVALLFFGFYAGIHLHG